MLKSCQVKSSSIAVSCEAMRIMPKIALSHRKGITIDHQMRLANRGARAFALQEGRQISRIEFLSFLKSIGLLSLWKGLRKAESRNEVLTFAAGRVLRACAATPFPILWWKPLYIAYIILLLRRSLASRIRKSLHNAESD